MQLYLKNKVAPTTKKKMSSIHDDDFDMLTVMANLEKATGQPVDVPDTSGETSVGFSAGPQTAADALASMSNSAAAASKMRAAGLSANSKAMRFRLSSASAAALTGALMRHPALHLHETREDLVTRWRGAVEMSLQYLEEDIVDTLDTSRETELQHEDTLGLDVSSGRRPELASLSAAGTQGIRNAFVFVQQCADALEVERIQHVFPLHASVTKAVERRVSSLFGVDVVRGVAYPGDAAAIAQRVWLHCLFGPLLSLEYADWVSPSSSDSSLQPTDWLSEQQRMCEVPIPLVSASIAKAVERIAKNVYDTQAWLMVIEEAFELPLAESRSALCQAAYVFPTSGPLICEIVEREMHALSSGHMINADRRVEFEEGDDEDDAKELFKGRLRLLNLFYRHLPRCTSWKLYDLFITFLQSHVNVDEKQLDQVFRVALDHHVGLCVDSTPLWLRYLEWRASKLRNVAEKQKFVRLLFHRILRTPLEGLAEVRERYDFFELSELRGGGRVRLEEELERSMTRAKSFATDRTQMFSRMLQQEFRSCAGESMQQRKTQPIGTQRVYLPRPFVLNCGAVRDASRHAPFTSVPEESGWCSDHGGGTRLDEDDRLEEQQLWLSWCTILRSECETNVSAAQTEEGHFKRVVFMLRMRASFFPHEAAVWLDLADAIVNGLPKRIRTDFGPSGDVGSAMPAYVAKNASALRLSCLQDALVLLPYHVHLTVITADALRMLVDRPVDGGRLIEEACNARKQRLLGLGAALEQLMVSCQRSTASGGNQRGDGISAAEMYMRSLHQRRLASLEEAAHRQLSALVVLVGNWMRYARVAFPRDGATQVRLVAQHTMHDVELLSLVMTTLKRLVKCSQLLHCSHILQPNRILHLFNIFCSQWVELELHQLHNADAALMVLSGWAQQLRTMLVSTKAQGWTLVECGVDELFFARAREIGRCCLRVASSAGAGLSKAPLVSELIRVVLHLVRHFPPLSASSGSDGAVQRRWILETLQDIDPVWRVSGALLSEEDPALLEALREVTTGHIHDVLRLDAAAFEEGGDAALRALQQYHAALWQYGLEGPAAGTESLRGRVGLFGTAPLPMLGSGDHVSASDSISEEYLTGDCTRLHQAVRELREASLDEAANEADDVDPVHPDAGAWHAYVPTPSAASSRGGRGGSRGRGGRGATRGGTKPSATLTEANAAEEGDDEVDTAADSVMLVPQAGESASQFVTVRGTMMSLADLKSGTALQASMHGRRMHVNVASSSAEASEGLPFSLDLAEAANALKRLREKELAGGGEGQPPQRRRRSEMPEALIAGFWSKQRPPTAIAHALLRSLPPSESHFARVTGVVALEALLGHALPSRYAFGSAFDERQVNVSWLLSVLKETSSEVRLQQQGLH